MSFRFSGRTKESETENGQLVGQANLMFEGFSPMSKECKSGEWTQRETDRQTGRQTERDTHRDRERERGEEVEV